MEEIMPVYVVVFMNAGTLELLEYYLELGHAIKFVRTLDPDFEHDEQSKSFYRVYQVKRGVPSLLGQAA
jgi:hypothetical protein